MRQFSLCQLIELLRETGVRGVRQKLAPEPRKSIQVFIILSDDDDDDDPLLWKGVGGSYASIGD